MEYYLYLVGLMVCAASSQACIGSITHKTPVAVAFAGESFELECDFTISEKEPVNVTWSVISDGVTLYNGNTQVTTNYKLDLSIKVQYKSATYYCTVKCGATVKTAPQGTYIYVRDAGYSEPADVSANLRSGLITLFVLLLLLSGAGTFLLLYPWFEKNQIKLPFNKVERTTALPDTQRGSKEKAGSVYASLQLHSDDVYDVLDNENGETKPCNKIKPTGNREKKPERKEKPPLAEKPQLHHKMTQCADCCACTLCPSASRWGTRAVVRRRDPFTARAKDGEKMEGDREERRFKTRLSKRVKRKEIMIERDMVDMRRQRGK
ncbi:NFAT activation molecule 1 [Pelobates cultripes]|uniref:NFAT activation molecule 1 n=1 Tax=Pelobates cultripes TaxID=61616 RepID=A0AAD1RJT1_PELCU|nr:NFAT activation molecule 1 [Pelobates cultripes]